MDNMPELLIKYINYIGTIKGKSPRTVAQYTNNLQNFFKFMLDYKGSKSPDINFIKSITLEDLYAYMAHTNNERDNNARSRARITSCLHGFFKYLHGNLRILDENPAQHLESPKIGKTLPAHLNLDNAQRLLATAKSMQNKRDFTIITLFLNCGMRLSELVSLNMSDIEGKTLVITGKGNKQRTVYLNQACLNALVDYLPMRQAIDNAKDNALFLNNHNSRLGARGVELLVDKYIKLAGLDKTKISVHKLRHTAATLMYQHGNVDVRALQEILGHEQLTTTEIYTHIDEKRLQEAVENNPLNSESTL